jgi:hypothetical protein
MKSIQIAVAVCFGFVLAGCGPSKALLSAQEYEKDACACKDAKCVAEAAKHYADRAHDAATAKSDETDAITKAATHAAECSTKAAMAGVPGMPAMPAMPK